MTGRRPALRRCAPDDPRCAERLCDACSAEKLAALIAAGMSPEMGALLAQRKTEDLEKTRLGKALLVPPIAKCEHPWHNFRLHGRCCWFCGAIVVDFGD